MTDRKLPVIYVALEAEFMTGEWTGIACHSEGTARALNPDDEIQAYEPIVPRCKTCRYYGHGIREDLHIATDADAEPDRTRHGACTEGGGLRWVRNDGEGYCDFHSDLGG